MVTPGTYQVTSSFSGNNWGDISDTQGRSDVAVQAGKDTVVEVDLGRIRVAVGATNTYVEVDYVDTSAGGTTNRGQSVAGGYTDNTGYWSADVTAGTYLVKVNNKSYQCVVTGGAIADVRP